MSDYKAMIDTLLTNYMNNYMGAQQKASEAKNRDIAVINAFNENPRLYKDNEKMRIALAAKSYGVPIIAGALKDKPSATQKAVALGGGVIDALLFGLLKNSWYSDDSTKGWADAGRIGGTLASFLIPGQGLGTVGKILFGGGKGLVAAKGALGIGNAAKVAKTIKFADNVIDAKNAVARASRLVKSTRTALKAATAAGDFTKVASSADDAVNAWNAWKTSQKAYKAAISAKKGFKYAWDAGKAFDLVKSNPIEIANAAARLGHAYKTESNADFDFDRTPDYVNDQRLLEWAQKMGYINNGEAGNGVNMPYIR